MRRNQLTGTVAIVFFGMSLGACKKLSGGGATATESGQVVAKIDDVVITVADLQAQINRQSPFVRARYSAPEKKKELLENLVRFEVMAREARAKGYDRDPDVQRMVKQQMISQLVQKELDAKLKPENVPDADVEKYFKDHAAEFQQSDAVRVSQILTRDKAKAQKAASLAQAAAAADPKVFRDLVTKFSEDEDSKPRGGDLTFFDAKNTQHPKAMVDAAFALKEVGDVSGPVQSDRGWHVIKLTQKRPGFSRQLTEVKPEIQRKLVREQRPKKMDELVAEMRKKVKVEIYEDALAQVKVDTTSAPGAPGPEGMMPRRPGSLPPPGGPGMPPPPAGHP